MPEGRVPYAIALSALSRRGIGGSLTVLAAIRSLARAQTDRTLTPLLSSELAEAIATADSFIDETGTYRQGFDFEAAEVILEVVLEHGYGGTTEVGADAGN